MNNFHPVYKQVQLQKGGTCWFHASMNGFLYSVYGRALLFNTLSAENIKKPSDDFCPSKRFLRSASRNQLLKLVKLYMSEGVHKENRNVLNAFTGFRFLNGGTMSDTYSINKKLFNQPDALSYKIYADTNTTWQLSHAYLELTFGIINPDGHTIVGVIDPTGRKIIIDSTGYLFEGDWTTKDGIQKIKDYLSLQYGKRIRNIIVHNVSINKKYLQTKWINRAKNNMSNNRNVRNMMNRLNNNNFNNSNDGLTELHTRLQRLRYNEEGTNPNTLYNVKRSGLNTFKRKRKEQNNLIDAIEAERKNLIRIHSELLRNTTRNRYSNNITKTKATRYDKLFKNLTQLIDTNIIEAENVNNLEKIKQVARIIIQEIRGIKNAPKQLPPIKNAPRILSPGTPRQLSPNRPVIRFPIHVRWGKKSKSKV